MAELIEVDPDQLKKAAQVTADLAQKVKEAVTTLRTTLSGNESDSANKPWGNDHTGKKFAEGDKGYVTVREDLLGGGDNMAETLTEFAQGQTQAANVMQGTDDDSAHNFIG